MMKTPWQYAETGNEYSHQVALFMWANMASKFGLLAANDERSYTIAGHAQMLFDLNGDTCGELQWLHAIKNAGHGDAIRGARSAAEGVKAGVPDMFLPVPKPSGYYNDYKVFGFAGLYIELKRTDASAKSKGVLSLEQDKWIGYLIEAGYCVETCYGWEAARNAILKYLGRS